MLGEVYSELRIGLQPRSHLAVSHWHPSDSAACYDYVCHERASHSYAPLPSGTPDTCLTLPLSRYAHRKQKLRASPDHLFLIPYSTLELTVSGLTLLT